MTFTIVMTENKELIRCSKCKNSKLTECFSVNPKGKLYKICDICKIPKVDTREVIYQSDKNKPKMTPEENLAFFKSCGPILTTYTVIITRHENLTYRRVFIEGECYL
jgi:hypothetical protein